MTGKFHSIGTTVWKGLLEVFAVMFPDMSETECVY